MSSSIYSSQRSIIFKKSRVSVSYCERIISSILCVLLFFTQIQIRDYSTNHSPKSNLFRRVDTCYILLLRDSDQRFSIPKASVAINLYIVDFVINTGIFRETAVFRSPGSKLLCNVNQYRCSGGELVHKSFILSLHIGPLSPLHYK